MIAEISDPSPLAALLREVNETVLGRSLTFESSGGSSLTLEVSGRRVLRLTGVKGLIGAESCLAAQALVDEHKDQLIKLLETVAAPRNELRVTAAAMGREGAGVSIGLPVALLADLLLIDLNPVSGGEQPKSAPRSKLGQQPEPEQEPDLQPEPEPEPEAEPEPAAPPEVPFAPLALIPGGANGSRLGRFARGSGPMLIAWFIAGGKEDGATEGPEEMVSHLKGFLEDEGEALSQQLDLICDTPDEPICIVLGKTLADGHSILCARRDDSLLVGVIEGDSTQGLLRAWVSALA